MMQLRRIACAHRAAAAPLNGVLSSVRWKSYVLRFVRGHFPHDLKELPGLVGCLYDSLPDADEYGAFRIPQEAIQSYHQLGYFVPPMPILTHTQCDLLADEAMSLANNEEHHPRSDVLYSTSLADLTGGPLFFCQGQWRACWGMHDLVFMPSLAVAASQLLGDVLVRLWYDEVVIKVGRIGPSIPWQQNYARWQHIKPPNHVTVVVALDSMNKDRSAHCVIPGSHRWRDGGLLPVEPYDAMKDEAANMNSIWSIVNEEEREGLMDIPPVTVELQRGQVMFIHPHALFATHGNRSFDNVRYVLLHYMGHPTFTVGAGAVLPRTTRFAANTPIQGPYFPVCFDPSVVEEPIEFTTQQESLPESSSGESSQEANPSTS